MKVSVIIPAFNEEKYLPLTIEAVRKACLAFAARGWESELVVCDNNSSDQTAEIARQAGARVVFEPVNQIGRARNTGAAAATGDWLLFVDADSTPSRELLDDVAVAIQSGRCLAGGATVEMDEFHLWAYPLNKLWNSISRVHRYVAGSFIFCERAAFQDLGGFSRDLFVAEEIEFSKRLKKLARQAGKQVLILHRHPLLTSARKLKTYSCSEHLRFLLGALFSAGGSFKRRERCPIWYDGKR